MWSLPLKGCINVSKSNTVDIDKLTWQKISRKGDYPTPRCGSVATTYKNKVIVFGGVFDSEGPRHSLVSKFYDDLFAFDMDRKRWYKLGLKHIKAKEDRTTRKERKTVEQEVQSDIEDEDSEEDEAQNHTLTNITSKTELFGYIDETGAVVYIAMDDIEIDNSNPGLHLETVGNDVGIETDPLQQSNADQINIDDMSSTLDQFTLQSVPKKQVMPAVIAPNFEGAAESSTPFHVQLKPCARINPCLMLK
jgi:hypothetical protein